MTTFHKRQQKSACSLLWQTRSSLTGMFVKKLGHIINFAVNNYPNILNCLSTRLTPTRSASRTLDLLCFATSSALIILVAADALEVADCSLILFKIVFRTARKDQQLFGSEENLHGTRLDFV
jgi:hypothetical protein